VAAPRRTRRAYATDAAQFAGVGGRNGSAKEPGCRREARAPLRGPLPTRRAPASTARKLARCSAVRDERARARSRTTCGPRRDAAASAHLPRVLSAREAARLLERSQRRARSSCATARSPSWPMRAALRAEEIVSLGLADVRSHGEQAAGRGKGGARRASAGRRACDGGRARLLERARGALAGAQRGARRRTLFLSKTGRALSTSDVRRRLSCGSRGGARRACALSTAFAAPRCGIRSRHTCSTAVPIAQHSRAARPPSVSSTQIYTR